MNAVVKLTGYEKTTEWLGTAMNVPLGLVDYARTVAGVSETDPDVLAMYPLTIEQAARLPRKAAFRWTRTGSTIVWKQ